MRDDGQKDLTTAAVATAAVAASQLLKHDPASVAQALDLLAPSVAMAASGSYIRERVSALMSIIGRKLRRPDAEIAALIEEASKPDGIARWNVAKVVREALEVVDDRALEALAGLAAEYLDPPSKAPDRFFRGAAEFFGRAEAGETDALGRLAIATLAAVHVPVVTILALDRRPHVQEGSKTEWRPAPWHAGVFNLDDRGSAETPRLSHEEPMTGLLVARLKDHHLGRPSEARWWSVSPDGVDLDRSTLERLARLCERTVS